VAKIRFRTCLLETLGSPRRVYARSDTDLIPIRPQCPKLKAFSDYISEYYLNDDSFSPPSLWACAFADLTRTTNACEAFHSHFSKAFYKAQPDIFRFVQQLISFQTDTYVNIQSLAQRGRFGVHTRGRRI